MGNPIININLSSANDYIFLAKVPWQNEASDRLVIEKISLRTETSLANNFEEGEAVIPHNLVSWFTDQGNWGRVIEVEEQTQKSEAELYLDLPGLRRLYPDGPESETLQLVVNCREYNGEEIYPEVDPPRDLTFHLHLYQGPMNTVEYQIKAIGEPAAADKEPRQIHDKLIVASYPEHIGGESIIPLADCAVIAHSEPIHPLYDKRLLLAFMAPLPATNSHAHNPFLTHRLTERLVLQQNSCHIPQSLCDSKDQLAELYPHMPPLPDRIADRLKDRQSFQCFGPVSPTQSDDMGSAAADRLQLGLQIKIDDPIWQEIFSEPPNTQQRNQDEGLPERTPHTSRFELTILLIDGEESRFYQFEVLLQKTNEPILALYDGVGVMPPCLLPLPMVDHISENRDGNHHAGTFECKQIDKPALIELPFCHAPDSGGRGEASSFLIFATLLNGDKPVTLKILPAERNEIFCSINPADISLEPASSCFHQKAPVLFQRPMEQRKNLPAGTFKTEFTLSLMDKNHNVFCLAPLILRLKQQEDMRPVAIAIGDEDLQLTTKNNHAAIESKMMISSLMDQSKMAYDAALLDDHNWRAQERPFSLSSLLKPWSEAAAVKRIAHLGRHYDIALGKAKTREEITASRISDTAENEQDRSLKLSHLKSLLLRTTSHYQSQHHLFLTQPKRGAKYSSMEQQGLSPRINLDHLMMDVMDECAIALTDLVHKEVDPAIESPHSKQDEETGEAKLSSPHNAVIFTHSAQPSPIVVRRLETAGQHLIERLTRGSFTKLGALCEWIKLPADIEIKSHCFMIEEAIASAYGNLLAANDYREPIKPKEVYLSHLHFGHETIELAQLTLWHNSELTCITQNHGTQSFPLGTSVLDFTLFRDCQQLLNQITKECGSVFIDKRIFEQVDLETYETLTRASWLAEKPAWLDLAEVLSSARMTWERASESKKNSDFRIELASSNQKQNLVKFNVENHHAHFAPDEDPQTIWRGSEGAQLLLTFGSKPEQWTLVLKLTSAELFSDEKLSHFYIEFLAKILLPALIENSEAIITSNNRGSSNRPNHLTSMSGSSKIVHALLAGAKPYLNEKLIDRISPESDGNQHQQIIAKGAIDYLGRYGHVRQNNLLRPKNGRDLLLITDFTEDGKISALARDKNPGFQFTPIEAADETGQIAIGAHSLKLVETLSNLGPFMANDHVSVVYEKLLADLPTPSAAVKKQLNDFWQCMFNRCYRILLDLPIEGPASSKPDTNAQALRWRYQTIRGGEAKFTIGAHKYWLSTGLSDTQK